MTQFGPQPERDAVETTQAEREAFALLAGNYGPWADPATEVRQDIEYASEMPETFLDGTPVPAGYGQANLEEVKSAMAEARSGIIDSHNAWLALGDEMADAIEKARKDSDRIAKVSTALGVIAGLAGGFGMSELLRAVIQ